jgi:predicted nucleic acid-binding protein
VIHLDASVLIDALTGPRHSMPALRRLIADGIRVGASALVLYEWRRGPRTDRELAIEQALLGPEVTVGFGEVEARLAADLHRRVPRRRGREIDLAIAACAVAQNAQLWTLNASDFADVPGLDLHRA